MLRILWVPILLVNVKSCTNTAKDEEPKQTSKRNDDNDENFVPRTGKCDNITMCLKDPNSPVCANGQTFPNACAYRIEKCNNNSLGDFTVGSCQKLSGLSDCINPNCSLGLPTTLVCGSDNQTYGNECVLKFHAKCNNKTDLTEIHSGECVNGSSKEWECMEPLSRCKASISQGMPVCGTDGVIYNNLCEYKLKGSCNNLKLNQNFRWKSGEKCIAKVVPTAVTPVPTTGEKQTKQESTRTTTKEKTTSSSTSTTDNEETTSEETTTEETTSEDTTSMEDITSMETTTTTTTKQRTRSKKTSTTRPTTTSRTTSHTSAEPTSSEEPPTDPKEETTESSKTKKKTSTRKTKKKTKKKDRKRKIRAREEYSSIELMKLLHIL